jgi:hypothetical protein
VLVLVLVWGPPVLLLVWLGLLLVLLVLLLVWGPPVLLLVWLALLLV